MINTYSNPRLVAVIENWPSGSKRVTARFEVEQKDGKERAIRTTTGKPVVRTFAQKVRIVDGDDGRTYIAELSGYGFVVIYKGDMKYQHEVVHASNPHYAEVLALFE